MPKGLRAETAAYYHALLKLMIGIFIVPLQYRRIRLAMITSYLR